MYGNVYMCGYSSDSLYFQSSDGQVYLQDSGVDSGFQLVLSSHDTQGKLRWIKGFPAGPFSSFAPDVDAWQERVALGGTFYTDRFEAFIQVFDSAGVALWTRNFSGQGDIWCHGIAYSPGGELFLTGRFTGDLDFPGGWVFSSGGPAGQKFQTFVIKLDLSGEILWAAQSGLGRDSRGQPLVLDPYGDVILGGYFSDSLRWNEQVVSSGKNGGRTPFIAKLDGASGKAIWLRAAIPDPAGFPNGVLYGLTCDRNRNIYGAGYIQSEFTWEGAPVRPAGNYENLVLSLDESGKLRWTRTFGSPDPEDREWASGIMISPYETLVVGANVYPGTELDGNILPWFGQTDLAVLEFDLAGAYLRAWVAGGRNLDFSYAGAIDQDGSLLFGGNTLSDALMLRNIELSFDTLGRSNSFLFKLCTSLPLNMGQGMAGIRVFPNPGKGVFWVEGVIWEGRAQALICNVLGQVIWHGTIISSGENEVYPLNAGSLEPGIYYLRLYLGGSRFFTTTLFVN